MFAAFVCWSSQETVDILIPLLLGREQRLSASALISLLIQVERRKKNFFVIKYEINQEFQFFPSPADNTTDAGPYVTLVAEVEQWQYNS